MMIGAVVFDMDGTITDTEKLNLRFWTEAGRRFGFDLEEEDVLFIRSLESCKASEYLSSRYPGFDFDEVREERRMLMREHVDRFGVEAKPGAREILIFLRERGVKTAVATASRIDHAEEYLESLGLHDLFDYVISTSMVGRGKPAPDVFLHACRCVGEDPSDCMAVEDSPNGVRSAHAAGCRTVMIPDLTPADDEMAALTELVASSLLELRDLLRDGRMG